MYAAKSIPPASGETGGAGVAPCGSTMAAQQKNLGIHATALDTAVFKEPLRTPLGLKLPARGAHSA